MRFCQKILFFLFLLLTITPVFAEGYKLTAGISVNDVADYIGIERTYFFRLFKKQMGMSPQDYLINLKMEKTKVLLKDSKKSIKEIAYSVGYTNYVSFVKIFKEKTGISPSEFRCTNK